MNKVIQTLRDLESMPFESGEDHYFFHDKYFKAFKDALREETDQLLSDPIELFDGGRVINEDKAWEIANALRKWLSEEE